MTSHFRRDRSFRPQQIPDAHRINDRITAKEVRVVGADGSQLGIMPRDKAISTADQSGLDLVEVAPTAQPPVCRIMNYGKYKYQEQKKLADSKKHRTEIETKEIRLRYNTDIGDIETKLRHAKEFFAEGNKVKFSMKFRGREIAYIGLGKEKLQQIVEALAEVASLDEQAAESGRQIYILLTPKSQKKKA